MMLAGEWIRLLAVRQIGVISRTRSDRLGPLIDSGPFAWVRNPLYLGNIGIWVGFALVAQLPWLAPIFIGLLLFEYHAIVSWEEGLLLSRIGDAYRDYTMRVPRWIPHPPPAGAARPPHGQFTWGDTLFSERGTLLAIIFGLGLLWLKARF